MKQALLVVFLFIAACSGETSENMDSGINTKNDGGRTTKDTDKDASIEDKDISNKKDLTAPSGSLSERFPGDSFPNGTPTVLFHSDFENGFAGWDNETSWSGQPSVHATDEALANNGAGAFKAAFTQDTLKQRGDSSVRLLKNFETESKAVYYRFYARFSEGTLRPHHWVRVCGYDGECPGGTAGIQPEGDKRFNTRVDIDGENRLFFYTYWHEMRSGRCNDGSATPGCEGDQGSTYYYGNRFKPAKQESINLNQWQCYEFMVKENTVGESDGEQAMWLNNDLLGSFVKGVTKGEWLRDNFYTDGEYNTDNQNSTFDGFNFRTDAKIKQRSFELEFYQQQNTFENRLTKNPNASQEQAIYFDDVVIATERIGCRQN